MSNYYATEEHPLTGRKERAAFLDDHFGPHRYGVHFPSDDQIYPLTLVNAAKSLRRAERQQKIWRLTTMTAFVIALLLTFYIVFAHGLLRP